MALPARAFPAGARFLVGFDEMPAPGVEWPGASVLAREEGARFMLVDARDAGAFAAAVRANARVRYIELDAQDAMRALWTPNDPSYPAQYALPQARAPAAWDLTRGSSAVKVAVLDSGIDAGHPDLTNDLAGTDMTGSGSTADGCGHGTHVAGILGATADNGRGVAGVAQVTILPVKVLGARCSGSFSNIARGITWSVDQGAHIISMSLGCTGCSSQAINDAVAYATSKGVLVLAASGNAGPCTSCVAFPATLPDVVAVGCTTSAQAVCQYSSRGPQVALSAPGDAILSTLTGGRYGKMSGTSMSTPLAAGVAALVLSNEPSLGRAALRERLLSTARDAGAAGRDTGFGHGIVDASAALGAATPTDPVARFVARASGLAVSVDGSASSDADGSIAAWSWDWGDGSARGAGRLASHSYPAGGTYRITLTVTDDDGRTAQATQTLAVTAPAAVGYAEDFDDGAAQGWTLTGLWHVDSACSGGASPPSSLQYNRAATCTYGTGGRTTGTATLAIDTSAMADPTLTFDHRYVVERTTASYDRMQVQASRDGGATWTVILSRDSRSAAQPTWSEASLDLSAYRGSATRVRFAFDSVDGAYNGYAGWSVDNVRIT